MIALPQRAAVAAGVDLEDLNGLYDLRKIIECEVARRAAEVADVASVATARAALVDLEGTGDTSQAEFWDRHRDFHWAVIEQGANPWVKRVLDQLWLAAERYVRLFHAVTFEDAMRTTTSSSTCSKRATRTALRRSSATTSNAPRTPSAPASWARPSPRSAWTNRRHSAANRA